MSISLDVFSITTILNEGGIIAYPTEAVYGLGCDPFNEKAVLKLLSLKNRPIEKGLILIASDWQQVAELIQPLPATTMQRILASWPGPLTWLLPATKKLPTWIRGEHESVAIRITAHAIARQLCTAFAKPLVSTSANLTNQLPALNAETVKKIFADKIDYVVEGRVGNLKKPTPIRDALTNKIIRLG